MSSPPINHNGTLGAPESLTNRALETGASHIQDFAPPKRICAHLNAFHTYATKPGERHVEANHYCAHLNDEVRQCLLYDTDRADARLIGVEYMISARLYAGLDAAEQTLWHSHVFEVKSGMLVMPAPASVPAAVWERAERVEMEQVVTLYGKAYHLWQVDRGDALPLGEPQLMTSYTQQGQLSQPALDGRDRRWGVDSRDKAASRKDIAQPTIHAQADSAWKRHSDKQRRID